MNTSKRDKEIESLIFEYTSKSTMSESDIREYVTKRKVSGSTRSSPGRRCRDTFTSLKKTCRKNGVSFWEYLLDRIGKKNIIPQLPDLIALKLQKHVAQ